MVEPPQIRLCKVCPEFGRKKGAMILHQEISVREGQTDPLKVWECIICGHSYPGPWGSDGPLTIRWIKGRIAYEKRELAEQRDFFLTEV